jgi:H+-transporting ATPase
MAEQTGASPGDSPKNHLGTDVPTGGFSEKGSQDPTSEKRAPAAEDEEEEEDMDALIEELESQEGHIDEEDEETDEPGGARPIPEELLNTDTRTGLSDQDVVTRRKKYGLNQMKEEKENLVLKFLGYFIGPIQFVMEVSRKLVFCCLCHFRVLTTL